MKAARIRALLFLAGLALMVWGVLPWQGLTASAAPLMAITETPTSEPPPPPPPPTNTPASQVDPTSTPAPTNTAAPTAAATLVPTATSTPETDESDDDDDDSPTAAPTAAPAPSAAPTAAAPPPAADPTISKSVSPAVAAVGDTVVYTIVVSNQGPVPAAGVTVEDNLPAFLALVDAQATRGTVSTTGRAVRVEIGDLAPGETVEVRVSARVVATATSPDNRNLAVVSSTSPDSNPDNNRASVPVDTTAPAAAPAAPGAAQTAPAALPNTAEGDSSPLPMLATALGLALIAGSALLRAGARRSGR